MKKLIIFLMLIGILGFGTTVSASGTLVDDTIVQYNGDPDDPGAGND